MPNRIQQLRREKKITQLQLSIVLGVTQETISAYEHERYLPSLEALMKMAEYFDTSMDYIMCLSNIRNIAVDNRLSIKETEQREKLLYHYNLLNSVNKTRLIAYAEGLFDASANK